MPFQVVAKEWVVEAIRLKSKLTTAEFDVKRHQKTLMIRRTQIQHRLSESLFSLAWSDYSTEACTQKPDAVQNGINC